VAVAWGPRTCFLLALACQAIGGGIMLVVLGRRFGALDVLVVGGGLLVQMVAVGWWASHYDATRVVPNYRRVMRLNALSAAALGTYLVARLLRA
jgi:hypothetical protein